MVFSERDKKPWLNRLNQKPKKPKKLGFATPGSAVAFLGRCFLLSILSFWLGCGILELAILSPTCMCSVELFLDVRARTSNGYILYIDLIIVVHCVHNLWTNTTMIVQWMNQHNDDSSRVIVLVLWSTCSVPYLNKFKFSTVTSAQWRTRLYLRYICTYLYLWQKPRYIQEQTLLVH